MDETKDALDIATRAWLREGDRALVEWSGDFNSDRADLLARVNVQRKRGSLPPIIPPAEWSWGDY